MCLHLLYKKDGGYSWHADLKAQGFSGAIGERERFLLCKIAGHWNPLSVSWDRATAGMSFVFLRVLWNLYWRLPKKKNIHIDCNFYCYLVNKNEISLYYM